jgi:hypothetical protein
MWFGRDFEAHRVIAEMTIQEKPEYVRRDFATRGLEPHDAVPPLWEALWNFGVDIRPPPFLGFWSHAGVLFAFSYVMMLVLFSVLAWLLSDSQFRMSVWMVLLCPTWVVVPSLITAWQSQRKFGNFALPPWSEYPKMQETKTGAQP